MRQEQSLAQTRQDIDEMLNHVNLVINDLGDPRRRDALWSPGTETTSSPQAAAAMRKVARLVPGAAEVIAQVARLDYSKPGKPQIDWDDAQAKQSLVSDLVNDALAVLAELTGDDAPQRDEAAADALGLLALVAGQDVEPAEGSDGADGRWRIARRVAPDRVISTVDPQARHTRKSKSTRKDGFRGHVSTEPETGLITDAELTSAAGEAGSDPVVGQQMIARDRFHRPQTETARPNTGDDAVPADEPPADQPGGDEALLAEPKPAAAAAVEAGDGGQITAGRTDSTAAIAAPADNGAGLQVYGDSAYGTGAARAAYRKAGHQTVIKPKPLRPAIPGGFTLDDFTIDEPSGTVTCPAGHTRAMSPKRTVTFGALCAHCPLRPRCTSAADGRSMSIYPHEQLLRAARGQARTPRFKQDYPTRSSVERDHRLGRHPARTPGQAALPGCRQKPCLAAQSDRRDQPAHPHQRRPHPPRRSLGPGLTARAPTALDRNPRPHPNWYRREERPRCRPIRSDLLPKKRPCRRSSRPTTLPCSEPS